MATYRIDGMDCAEEVAVLRRALAPLVDDPERLSFDVIRGTLSIALTPLVTDAAVREAVAGTGMRAQPADGEETDRGGSQRGGRLLATVVSGVALGVAMVLQGALHGSWRAALGLGDFAVAPVVMAAAVVAIVAGGWFVLPKALNAARHLRPDMNLLMVVAVIGAAAIGEWLEAATVTFLFAVSLALESWSVGRARRAVEALLDLAPAVVHLTGAGGERDVPAVTVAVGATFAVKPGERIPLDGVVIAGTSDVDQAPITGESRPAPKSVGDAVYAGTINGSGALDLRSTKAAGDTTLAHIVRLVGSAGARRARAEQWVDRFARIYTPAILILAMLVWLLPPLLLGAAWSDWIYRALVLLVIGCPCALVISTPVAIVAGLAAAARRGVLVKGGIALEAAAGLRTIALDKTGTLTVGRPTVRQVVPLSGHSEGDLLALAAALDARSTHPLALAIVAHAARAAVLPVAAQDVVDMPGRGITGTIAGVAHWSGSHRLLEEGGRETPELHQRLVEAEQAGNTVVIIGNHAHVCGFICLGDSVRPEAAQAVAALRAAGIEHVAMLTGDNRGAAEAIARDTGVDEVLAGLLPADKVTAVERLVATRGMTAMVGDGINDAPALARASLGIAMGVAGSDAAIETADVALMADDLGAVAWLIGHARLTLAIIRQNVVLALGIKALFLVLTLFGHASLWAAIAADIGATLVVIFNGLRLLRVSTR